MGSKKSNGILILSIALAVVIIALAAIGVWYRNKSSADLTSTYVSAPNYLTENPTSQTGKIGEKKDYTVTINSFPDSKAVWIFVPTETSSFGTSSPTNAQKFDIKISGGGKQSSDKLMEFNLENCGRLSSMSMFWGCFPIVSKGYGLLVSPGTTQVTVSLTPKQDTAVGEYTIPLDMLKSYPEKMTDGSNYYPLAQAAIVTYTVQSSVVTTTIPPKDTYKGYNSVTLKTPGTISLRGVGTIWVGGGVVQNADGTTTELTGTLIVPVINSSKNTSSVSAYAPNGEKGETIAVKGEKIKNADGSYSWKYDGVASATILSKQLGKDIAFWTTNAAGGSVHFQMTGKVTVSGNGEVWKMKLGKIGSDASCNGGTAKKGVDNYDSFCFTEKLKEFTSSYAFNIKK